MLLNYAILKRLTESPNLVNKSWHLYSYSVCIRKQEGFCCVQYQACADQANSFTLDTLNTAQSNDELCTDDYISIPGKSHAICK